VSVQDTAGRTQASTTLGSVQPVRRGALPKHVSRLSDALDANSLNVIPDIAPDDPMYAYAPDLYFGAGQSALRAIRLAMLAADVDRVANVLDFACGFGRVLRFLSAAFPNAALTGCDIRKDKVEWISKTFGPRGVVGVVSAFEPEEIRFDRPFDMIWVGSLLTHVESDRWTRFLRLFESILAPGGIVVFTVYGSFIAELVPSEKNLLNLTPDQAREVIRDYDATGFGFHVTPPDGDAIAKRLWVCKQLEETPSLELVSYAERAWMW
jgi:SAM-dependent methyltransferase